MAAFIPYGHRLSKKKFPACQRAEAKSFNGASSWDMSVTVMFGDKIAETHLPIQAVE